ncbi:MAG: SPW repeat domain-containing protein, partial [Bacteroidia bacterium]
IQTKIHGTFDYLIGIALVLSAFAFDFANFGTAQSIPVIIGISLIVYSVFTNYELGAVAVLEVRSHLIFDFIAGFFLLSSPWLYDFSDYVFLPHVMFGLTMMGVALFSETGIRSSGEEIKGNQDNSTRPFLIAYFKRSVMFLDWVFL